MANLQIMTLRSTKQKRSGGLSRSEIMSRVKSKDTEPELRVRHAVWASGLRYRLHDKTLPGCPDLIFPGRRSAVFVHGCFWHCHEGCSKSCIPKTRTEWWADKFARNKRHDRMVQDRLEGLGWHVFVIWQCELEEVGAQRLAQLIDDLKAIRIRAGSRRASALQPRGKRIRTP
jgi:DNA mismatch endonuclease, patch repair protein